MIKIDKNIDSELIVSFQLSIFFVASGLRSCEGRPQQQTERCNG